jgi:hypothetical protein
MSEERQVSPPAVDGVSSTALYLIDGLVTRKVGTAIATRASWYLR